MSNSNIHNNHISHNVFDIHDSLFKSNLILSEKIKNCSKNFSRKDGLKKNGMGYVKNVPHQCHLHKVCPICKISQQKTYRKDDWKDYRLLFDNFSESDNPKILRLTLTLKKRPFNNLKMDIKILNKCFNQLCQSYIWRRMKKENKWMFVTKVLEIKTSKNKFNPHLHLHLGFKNKKMTNEEMSNSLRRQWIKETKKFKMTSEYGVHLKTLKDSSGLNYIRKIEHQRVVDHETFREFFKENESDQMKRLKERIESEDITHSKDQKFKNKKIEPSYTIEDLEKLHHSYLNDETFINPNISHNSVKGQLRQIYGYLGKEKTVTTTRSYSPEFKDLKKGEEP